MASQEFYDLLGPWLARMADRPERLDVAWLKECMGGETTAIPGTDVRAVMAGSVPAEWVCYPGARADCRVLYLHGCGYLSGSAANYREFTSELSKATGCAVLAADYRVGPEDPFPAAVEDAVIAYQWMRQQGPDVPGACAHSFIMGDSAGGGLTLATLIALRDAGQSLPDGAVTISAYTDLLHTGDSVQTRAAVDPVAPPSWLPDYAGYYLNGADPRHPLASPFYADLTGLPPLLMQVGDAELLLDDTTRVAEKARAAGVQVQCEVWPEMIHVWHIRHLPESVEAVEHITRFVTSLLGSEA